MKELVLKVDGMVCSGCENRIKRALDASLGLKDVKASYEEGSVVITLDKDIDKKSIIEKIEEIGFEVLEDE